MKRRKKKKNYSKKKVMMDNQEIKRMKMKIKKNKIVN